MSWGIYLNLTLHNHQPVGNFPWVFQDAYEKAYLPTLELLEAYPQVPATLHYTGPLWDWLRASQPDFLRRLKRLVGRGQVELLAGAYYEPILAAIPRRDQIGQIQAMRARIEAEFGVRARGMWLAERVWEPHLPEPMALAGVDYTVLDDAHFHYAGVAPEESFGYYITEHEGHLLKVVPSLKALRYLIPWEPVEATIAYLRRAAADQPRLACMGDDGEKFGLWPQTYQGVWESGWLETFMEAVVENGDWLWPVRLDEYVSRFPPTGRVYLPAASYFEMTEWALPAEQSQALERVRRRLEAQGEEEALTFLRGTFWRNFLVKYPESNRLHKRMLRVHRLVWDLPQDQRSEALEELWRAQCNCPYWHGVFGGIYLPHIRSANWRHLLRAESLAEQAIHGPADWRYEAAEDLDGDGREELVLASDRLFLVVDPHRGGRLNALDGRRVPWAYLNTVSRRREAYHLELRKGGILPPSRQEAPEGSEVRQAVGAPAGPQSPPAAQGLRFDAYERLALLDHFLPDGLGLRGLADGMGGVGQFLTSPFESELRPGQARLWREGRALDRSVRLQKRLRLEPGSPAFTVELEITHRGRGRLQGRYGSEWNLALLWGHAPQAGYDLPGRSLEDPHLDARGEERDVRELVAATPPLGIGLRFRADPPATLWRFPLHTVANSEAGLERVYQASTIVWVWPLDLGRGETWKGRLTVELEEGVDSWPP